MNMKERICIGIACLMLLSCSSNRVDLIDCEKAMISYHEFKKYEDKDCSPISTVNVAVNLDSLQTYSSVETHIKNICSGKFPEAKYNSCKDDLPFIFNLKDFTFKPSKEEQYNIKIPAFEFQCGLCMVEPLSRYFYDIHLTKNRVYIAKNCFDDDTIEYKNTLDLSKSIDDYYKSYFKKFFNHSEIIYKLLERKKIHPDYYTLCNPSQIRISMDTSMQFRNLEPLISLIINSYTENLNVYTEIHLKKPLKELSILELRLLEHNIKLNIQIVRPREQL